MRRAARWLDPHAGSIMNLRKKSTRARRLNLVCPKLFSPLLGLGLLALPMLLLWPSALTAQESVSQIEAYTLESGELVFRGERRTSVSGGVETVKTVYSKPDGTVIQEEEASYDVASLKLIAFSKLDHRNGRREEMKVEGGEVYFLYQEDRDEDTDTDEIDWEDGMVFSYVIVPTIRKRWEAIKAGEEVEFDLLVPSRQEEIGFRFVDIGTETVGGRSVTVVQMEPSSFIIRQLVDPLKFYMADEAPHPLVRYVGRSGVADDEGDDQDLRFDYP